MIHRKRIDGVVGIGGDFANKRLLNLIYSLLFQNYIFNIPVILTPCASFLKEGIKFLNFS